MSVITTAILKLAEEEKNSASPTNWKETETKFDCWFKDKKKNLLSYYFDDPLFCAQYTLKKFTGQIKLFTQVLETIGKLSNIKSIMKTSESIVSFGCGPGPEILAYNWHVRRILVEPKLSIKFTAVDQLAYWGKYISKLNEMSDPKTKIQFKNETLCESYLNNMAKADICIMLFPHAMNFPDLWSQLKEKFILIILVDIVSKAVQNKLINCGFAMNKNKYIGIYTFVNRDNFFSKYGRNIEDVADSKSLIRASGKYDKAIVRRSCLDFDEYHDYADPFDYNDLIEHDYDPPDPFGYDDLIENDYDPADCFGYDDYAENDYDPADLWGYDDYVENDYDPADRWGYDEADYY